MTPQTPYSADLGSREPLSVLRDTMARIQTLAAGWAPAQFERTYAPGKWTAREILTHLAQTELALGNRARMALTTPGYTAQSFDQDRWMEQETGASAASRGSRGATGPVALEALVALNAMNRALFESLTPAERATPFAHPEYGALTIDWLIHQMAGHVLHHLKQLDEIAQL
jgi:hypothetical protein